MLSDAKRLAREGVAVHWLRPKSKAPIENDWSNAPVYTAADLADDYRDGNNVGIRLGEPSELRRGLYLYVLDIDVKGEKYEHYDQAYAALKELLPDYERFPHVLSGGGGDGRHVYFVSKSLARSKKLVHSKEKVEWEDKAGKKHKSWAWEIELFGTGKQVAAPPSIHPETGNAYKWGREIDFDDLDFITLDVSEFVGAAPGDERDEERGSSTRDDSSRSLSDIVNRKKLNLSLDEAWDYLLDLNHDEWCFDYEGWLKVGMAIHHEFDGSAEGLELYQDFSKRADNYDADAVEDKWKSFGKDSKRRPVRFATLINAGAMTRLRRERTGKSAKELEDDGDDWRVKLTLNEKGMPEPTSDNVAVIIENDERFKGIFGRNRFVEDVCIVQEPPLIEEPERRQGEYRQLDSWLWKLTPTEKREGRPLEDDHLDEIRLCMESPVRRNGLKIKVSDRDLRAAITAAANKNPYHPIQNYLDGLEWDGVERMQYLFVDYLGCPDDEYHRQTAKLWLLAAVARVYQPGHKFDFVPIFEGVQGIRKSTFIRILGRHWFVELGAQAFEDPKKTIETLVGQWIAEIPELHGFSRSEVGAVKAFFSRNEEKVREAYGRKAKRFLRQSVYGGTTNDREYLRDPTGNRRFWPIQILVSQIDTDKLEKLVHQIWAEAVVEFKKLAKDYPVGRLPLFLHGAEANETARVLQESRVIETQAQGWAGLISAWANTRVPLSVIEGRGDKFDDHDGDDPLQRRELICGLQVWTEVLKGSHESYGRGNTLKVVEAIRQTGEWEDAGRFRIANYGLQRCFKRTPKKNRTLDDLLG